MKDRLCATLNKEHVLECPACIIGRAGENYISILEIILDECLSNYWFYLDFVKPDGSTYKTPKLDILENKVMYEIPNVLLSERGSLVVQAVLQNENGEVWKSTIKRFTVKNSINATDDIPNQVDFITEAQRILNEIEEGLTPSIGENGNWFILGKDTEKTSRGPKGDTYNITNEDMKEIETQVKIDIQPQLEEMKDIAETAESIAKGANQSLSFGDYATMTSVFNSLQNDVYRIGQNILIITLNVPDLWVSNISEERTNYTYTTDEDLINLLKLQGYVQVGYYKLSALETQKVDLTEYATKEYVDILIGDIEKELGGI